MAVLLSGESRANRTDVYFLADTTASMGSILEAVQAGANAILASLAGLGADLAIGVGSYKDFPIQIPAFRHQLAPSVSKAKVMNAINTWEASGGADLPESQLFALDALAEDPGGATGWRAGSRRIVVWFGDAPGHDPVCAAISGLPYTITEASVTEKLQAQAITVLAISTDTGVEGALDAEPTIGDNYTKVCGPARGVAGQATRIARATCGQHVSGINASTIVAAITGLVSSTTSGSGEGLPAGRAALYVVPLTPLHTPSYLQPGALGSYIQQVRSQFRSQRHFYADPRGNLNR